MTLLHVASGPYDFHWPLHPDAIFFALFLEFAYLYVITQLRPAISDAGRVPRRQIAYFTGGVLAVFAVSGTPVHDLSEQYLLSFHMVQHTVIILIAAPLLLAGIPAWVWQALLRIRGVMPVARAVTHPASAIVILNGVLVFTHLPLFMDWQLRFHWFHFVVHATQLSAGLVMWWPVLSKVPELPPISPPMQIGYLFVHSLIPAIIASFITFADHPIYEFYRQAPRTWGLSPIEDQQIGGGIFKLSGAVILWSMMTVIFFQWWSREQAEQRSGVRWEEVRGELEEMGLRAPE